MKFGYTIIYVENVQKTLNFYAAAFDLKIHFIHESNQYGELKTGETILAFASNDLIEAQKISFQKNTGPQKSPGFELAFICENSVDDAFHKAIKNNCKSLLEPHDKPWGQRVAYVKDFNGIIVELCSPINMDQP